jgi:2-polyprenyl-3-methyl-5-hydroxy-6-metoxy-1,4-benzoquinol methylase
MEVKKCPGCGSGDFELISSYRRAIESELNGIKFTQPPYSIIVCRHCGLHFKDNIMSPEEFLRYYENVDFGKWNINEFYPPENIILNYLSKKTTRLGILDYGCSEGRLLASLVPQHDCYGFDYNAGALEIAKKKGIRVFYDMDEMENCGRQFDVILMIDVFEHLLDPSDTIRRLLQLLKKDGELIISTGYANSRAYLKMPSEFWYFQNLEHVCMISDDYLRYISDRNGLEVAFRKRTSHYKVRITLRAKWELTQFLYWNTLKMRKYQWLGKFYPFSGIFKLKTYPYYPATRDHLVVALRKLP